MSWVTLSLCSAIFLGFYEIAKKSAVRGNAVPPVLFFNVLTSAVIWSSLMLMARINPQWIMADWLVVESLSWKNHALLFAKSLIAGSSWIFASFALKHLPMSIAAPIRASSPLCTILIAVVFMQERPGLWQWVGVTVILFFLLCVFTGWSKRRNSLSSQSLGRLYDHCDTAWRIQRAV